MTGSGPKSPSQDSPVKVAFYGLIASELDLFTLVARHARASLVLVVDQGPMGLARRLGEIAGVPTSSDPWDLVGARADWIVTGGFVHSRGAPLERAQEGGARLLEAAHVSAELEKLTKPEPMVPLPAGQTETQPEQTVTAPAARAEASPQAGRAPFEVRKDEAGTRSDVTLQSLEAAAGPSNVVTWALNGLMSSVGGRWGVALARANDHVHFVEKGIDIRQSRPDLWQWLNDTIQRDTALPEAGLAPPPSAGTLAWALLKADVGLVGAMLLGREEGGAPFSSKDRTWLERVGERVASILCYTSGSELDVELSREESAPASVWAAPVLERARWARGWVRDQFKAKECWLFLASGSTPVPQLVDEEWGSAGPPFLQKTIQEGLERRDPQVWLEKDGDRAMVLQPLGPWGVKGVLLLESVPWRGDGSAALARLKKAAATIGRLLNNI